MGVVRRFFRLLLWGLLGMVLFIVAIPMVLLLVLAMRLVGDD